MKRGILAVSCALCALGLLGGDGDVAPRPSGKIIATEQSSSGWWLIEDGSVTWTWNPKDDPRVDAGLFGHFGNPSEVKVHENGKKLLVVCSGGAFGQIDIGSKRLDWYGLTDGNPHSIDRLPDGRVTVICSDGNKIVLVDPTAAPFDPARQRRATYKIPAGHGVVWDAKRGCLWAVGKDELVKFRYVTEAFALIREKTYDFSNVDGTEVIWGHDLVLGQDGKLVITATSHLLTFDPAGERFALLYAAPHVKSYSASRNGVLTVIPTEQWWTDTLTVEKDGKRGGVGPFRGARFYKARWFE